jgi:hypothetical protein
MQWVVPTKVMATSAICHKGKTTLGQPQGEDNGTKTKSDLRVP